MPSLIPYTSSYKGWNGTCWRQGKHIHKKKLIDFIAIKLMLSYGNKRKLIQNKIKKAERKK